MPMTVLYSPLTCVLMIKNVISTNTKCYSSISNLITEKLGWDYSRGQKKICIWDREKKLSGSAAGLGWGKASTFKYLRLLAAGILWGLFAPVNGTLSPNSMNDWNAFVMNWDFSEKQVARASMLEGFELSTQERCWNVYWCLLILLHQVHLKGHEVGAM